MTERRFEDIQVREGIYHITAFSDTGLVNVHFNYGRENRGHEFMMILENEPYHESSRDENGQFFSKAAKLRKNLHELQSSALPDDIKRILRAAENEEDIV